MPEIHRKKKSSPILHPEDRVFFTSKFDVSKWDGNPQVELLSHVVHRPLWVASIALTNCSDAA